MKKLTNLCLILAMAFAILFCITACDSGSEQSDYYEITVDTQNVSVDTSAIKVCLYTLDGTAVKEANLTNGKAQFDLEANSYVATLSGLDEKVSFSSVLLTENRKKATIALDNSEYDNLMEYYSFSFTFILLNGDRNLNDLSAKICDFDISCKDVTFDNGNILDYVTNGGECSVEVFDADEQPLYNETFTVDLDQRFYIIQLLDD